MQGDTVLAQTSGCLFPREAELLRMRNSGVDTFTMSSISGIVAALNFGLEVNAVIDFAFGSEGKYFGVHPKEIVDFVLKVSESEKQEQVLAVKPVKIRKIAELRLSQGNVEAVENAVDAFRTKYLKGSSIKGFFLILGEWKGEALASFGDIEGFEFMAGEEPKGKIHEVKPGWLMFSGFGRIDSQKSRHELNFAFRMGYMLGAERVVTISETCVLRPSESLDLGDIVAFSDIVRYNSVAPLYGQNVESWGERFIDYSAPFETEKVKEIAKSIGFVVNIADEGALYTSPATLSSCKKLGCDFVSAGIELYSTVTRHQQSRTVGREYKLLSYGVATSVLLNDKEIKAGVQGEGIPFEKIEKIIANVTQL